MQRYWAVGKQQLASSQQQQPRSSLPHPICPPPHPAVELTAEMDRSRPEPLPCTCSRGASLPSTSLSGRTTGSWPCQAGAAGRRRRM